MQIPPLENGQQWYEHAGARAQDLDDFYRDLKRLYSSADVPSKAEKAARKAAKAAAKASAAKAGAAALPASPAAVKSDAAAPSARPTGAPPAAAKAPLLAVPQAPGTPVSLGSGPAQRKGTGYSPDEGSAGSAGQPVPSAGSKRGAPTSLPNRLGPRAAPLEPAAKRQRQGGPHPPYHHHHQQQQQQQRLSAQQKAPPAAELKSAPLEEPEPGELPEDGELPLPALLPARHSHKPPAAMPSSSNISSSSWEPFRYTCLISDNSPHNLVNSHGYFPFAQRRDCHLLLVTVGWQRALEGPPHAGHVHSCRLRCPIVSIPTKSSQKCTSAVWSRQSALHQIHRVDCHALPSCLSFVPRPLSTAMKRDLVSCVLRMEQPSETPRAWCIIKNHCVLMSTASSNFSALCDKYLERFSCNQSETTEKGSALANVRQWSLSTMYVINSAITSKVFQLKFPIWRSWHLSPCSGSSCAISRHTLSCSCPVVSSS